MKRAAASGATEPSAHAEPTAPALPTAPAELSAPAELLRALAVLAEPPGPEHGRLAELVGLEGSPEAAAFTEVFVLQLPPYASIHLGPEGMLGGAARERIAGFWRALGQTAPAEPDHLSALLGLYAALLEEARAGDGPQGVLLRQAHESLLHEHLAPWVFAFLDRVGELAIRPYARWGGLLAELLAAEVERSAPPDRLPLHLREAPELPDPRSDGGRAFLGGLLAPVRSGVVLTRAALARLGRALGLGVRLGERRYVLEHLLGLEPAGVMVGLSEESDRQRAEHEARRALLGETATFAAVRAGRTAALLAELVAERAASLADAVETAAP